MELVCHVSTLLSAFFLKLNYICCYFILRLGLTFLRTTGFGNQMILLQSSTDGPGSSGDIAYRKSHLREISRLIVLDCDVRFLFG